jgi:hypothetical protein
MHLPEFILLLIATVVGIAAGLAMVVSNYRVARVLFWIAALSFGSLGIVWSQQSNGYSLATQMIVAAICAAIAAAGLVWGLREIRGRANASEPISVTDNPPLSNAASSKNSPNISAGGNVTIGHIGDMTINQAPQPELKLSGTKSLKNPDGTFSLTTEAEIVSPYPPGSLRLEAWAPSILSFDAIPQRVGMSMTGHSGLRLDHAFTTLMQPHGKYLVVVRTKEPANIDLRYDFDK